MHCTHRISKAHEELVCRACGENIDSLERVATELMQACYEEANRLANHGSSGLEKRVMSRLYECANDAKTRIAELLPNDKGLATQPAKMKPE